jgi:hypothetical protein
MYDLYFFATDLRKNGATETQIDAAILIESKRRADKKAKDDADLKQRLNGFDSIRAKKQAQAR